VTSFTENQVTHAPNADIPMDYNPNRLLDCLIERLQLKNDAALSRLLEVAPPVISKIRHQRMPLGASILLRMHEVSDVSIRDLRYLMGDRRGKYFTGNFLLKKAHSGHAEQIPAQAETYSTQRSSL
jgi:hypothetical protein